MNERPVGLEEAGQLRPTDNEEKSLENLSQELREVPEKDEFEATGAASQLWSGEANLHHRRGDSSPARKMTDGAEGVGVSLLRPPHRVGHAQSQDLDSAGIEGESFRNEAAFWLLGLINNSPYVIMMAVAKEIAPGAVGVVFLADVAPTMLVKLSAPYWFHLVPYSTRVWICTALLVLSLATVGYGGSTAIQLIGVCFSAVQAGLGESSFLALASFYETPRALTAWSSGTGFAGIFGYAWVFLLKVLLGLSFRATLMMANLLGLVWLYAFFRLLTKRQGRSANGNSNAACSHAGAYSPVQLRDSLASPSRHTNAVRAAESQQWKEPDLRDSADVVGISRAAGMTALERLRFTLGLWRFTVPLMLVYFAEYTMQTGTWSAIGFPVTSKSARERFYRYANWCYQGGVFFSRSSGLIVRLSPSTLWILPALQLFMLIFFYLVAVEQFWYGNSLLFLCFGVGLIGGLGYVNAFRLVAEAVPANLAELALASASIGDSFGVMFSDMFGTFVQACVYKHNGLPGAWATC